MASNVRAQRLNGLNSPLSYMGVQPTSPQNFTIQKGPPTSTDVQNFYVGDWWLDNSSYPANPPAAENLWFLASKIGNQATWRNFASGKKAVEFLTGNSGGPVGVDVNDNINVVGDGTSINIVGNPATNTLTVSAIGGEGVNSVPTDSGTANPVAGVLNIITGNSTLVSGSSVLFTGSGNTVELKVTDSKRNTLIGQGAGIAGITGFDNTGVGDFALSELTSGGTNTALGSAAGVGITSGTSNTLIGYETGDPLTTGSNNIALGYEAGVSYGAASASNITIGNIGASESNTIRIGTQGTSAGQQNAAYMAGIYNTSVGTTNQVVIVDSTGKLGSTPYPARRSAFQAALSTDITNATGAGTAATVVFDTIIFDLHGDYNTSTGIWTAPYNGIYQFNYTVAMENITSAMTQIVMQMILTGTGPSTLGNPAGVRNGCYNVISTNNPQWRFGSSVTLSLNAGDTAKVIVTITNGVSNTASINGQTVATGFATHFSGFLVAPT